MREDVHFCVFGAMCLDSCLGEGLSGVVCKVVFLAF